MLHPVKPRSQDGKVRGSARYDNLLSRGLGQSPVLDNPRVCAVHLASISDGHWLFPSSIPLIN
jgi:hypothetical protein